MHEGVVFESLAVSQAQAEAAAMELTNAPQASGLMTSLHQFPLLMDVPAMAPETTLAS